MKNKNTPCVCGESKTGICDGSHNKENKSLLRSIAVIRTKATGNAKVDKVFGQIRHFLESPVSVMLALGAAGLAGLNITPESWAMFWNLSSVALDSIFLAVGSVGKLIIHASSWYSKDPK